MRRRTALQNLIALLIGMLLVWGSHWLPLRSSLAQAETVSAPISSVPFEIYTQSNLATPVPDWSQVTFSSLPALTQNNDFVAPTDWSQAIGYDLSRSARIGMTPDQYLKLGDFQDSLYLQFLTLQSIAAGSIAGDDLSQVSLENFELVRNQTLESLTQAIPGLGNFPINQVAPVQALLAQSQIGIERGMPDLSRTTIAEVIQWKPDLGNLRLGTIKLDQFSITEIPGLKDIPLANLKDWQNSLIQQVPGLKDLPFSQFPVSLFAAGAIGIVDIAYGPKETDRTNTISGSDVEGFRVPCKQNCAYTELAGPQPVYGKQWISGKYQQVRGGHGLLAAVNGGMEPTGRHPYGKLFKVVIWDVVEPEGRVETALFFRYCQSSALVDLGCTPYFIGPVPFMTYHETNPILVGLLDDQGGATTGVSVPEDVLEKARQAGVPLPGDSEFGSTDSSLCGEGPGGVDMTALATAVSGIEGGYKSAGYYDPVSGGRGLGRYQYMTFRTDVRAIIAKHPGGVDFLRRADVNNNSSGYIAGLERELPNYFTPADQDVLFKQDQANNIKTAMSQTDPTTGKRFTGTRLIERLGQIHFCGPDPDCIDSRGSDIHGRLSVYQYGKELARNYQQALKSGGKPCNQSAGQASGKFQHPVTGAVPVTSEFGPRNTGIPGASTNHKGIDLGVPSGTPVKAADGGRVIYAGWAEGYGNVVIIDHGKGMQTRYAHLDSFKTKVGAIVAPGQVIANSGATGIGSGAHLHFEIRTGANPNQPFSGTAVNPRDYVRF